MDATSSQAPGDSSASKPPQPKRSLAWRVVRGFLTVLLTTVVVIAGMWATAALSLANLHGAPPRLWLPIVFGLAFLAVLIMVRPHRRGRLVAAGLVLLVFAWYQTIRPSNDRDWGPSEAKLATATIDGERITIHNFRTLAPGPDGKDEVTYVDRSYELNDLEAVDFIMSFWGPTAIGHALVSFEFTGGRHVAMSIEVRKEITEKSFNPITSLFRNFELIYIVGDERTLIGPGVTDGRHQVYLYPTNVSPQRTRALFIKYVEALNGLAQTPKWYNALTDNCTTAIYMKLRQIPPPPPFNISILVNGYLPEYIYAHRALDGDMPWAELHRRCNITEAGNQAFKSPDFSELIRKNLPYPPTRKLSFPTTTATPG